MDIANLKEWYKKNYEFSLKGRLITFQNLKPKYDKLPKSIFKKEVLGYSDVGKVPIHKITVGNGAKRILIWSQMHGNESTGTKAVFDFFCLLHNPKKLSIKTATILNRCTIIFIPLLNPDGAVCFTRENGNNVDLNRDAVELKAGESRLLRKVLNEFKPHFCFNLHDQRSIFNVDKTLNPATISFLAPSEDAEKTVTKGRKQAMAVIVAMNKLLQKIIPNQVGRYTDEFYPTATGDNFQKLGHNTILIEAGHYKDDYSRDKVREFNFYALLQGISYIANTDKFETYKSYFKIPNNNTMFLDKIYKNVKIGNSLNSVGIQYKFKVENNILERYEHIEVKGDLSDYCSYNIVDMKKCTLKDLLLRIS